MHNEQEHGETVTHVSAEEARSGSSTHVTRYVLGVSLALVIIAFAIVVGGGFFNTNQTGADETHTADVTANTTG